MNLRVYCIPHDIKQSVQLTHFQNVVMKTWDAKFGSTEHSEKSIKDIHILQVFNMTIKPIEYSNFPPLK